MTCARCPLTLLCYAGRLVPVNWCPMCHYLVCRNEPGAPTLVTGAPAEQVRLRCEPRTEWLKRHWIPIEGSLLNDPMATQNRLGVTKCMRCDTEERLRKGMKTAFDPAEFDKVELD